MGRPYTGAATVYSSPRLELSGLLKVGYFTKDAEVSGSWTWTNGDAVRIFTKRKGAEVYMELSYTWTDTRSGQREDVRQRFDMVSKPSNLGRGHVLYFRCPQTGRACRILYRAYYARTFRSRWGFSYRLYYPSQTCGKLHRWDETYWSAERQLERSKGKRKAGTYRGKPTKRSKRRERLYTQLERADERRWSLAAWPKRFRGMFTDLR
mgnify:CR=1 FL=1